ncbi:hypothetical protein ATE84_4531 [Aquimarina sp. MAR_2010_214]|uniref:hypothetical protein n=1 Tax=Aquimarina sp. MAR_2010_214 TaxID=1250026 RepID=UPI000C714798|nr:hypothetical protein [Aquimarina sp. MAR_2010_214]PKV52416.1 hypothetical protein ATE84_4531 [Aquimarina sp. MAR_2010_214]
MSVTSIFAIIFIVPFSFLYSKNQERSNYKNVYCTAYTSQTSDLQDSLPWPDTSKWKAHVFKMSGHSFSIKLPGHIKLTTIENDIVVILPRRNTKKIDYRISLGKWEDLDMKEERSWLEGSSNRKDLVWLIDEENIAYYTGIDLTIAKPHQTTHSFYCKKRVGAFTFFMNIDGIRVYTIRDMYSLTQEGCLLFISAFKTIKNIH